MENPQQPELDRSGRGEVDQEGRRIAREADQTPAGKEKGGPVPPENRPGHKPDEDQDKPPPIH